MADISREQLALIMEEMEARKKSAEAIKEYSPEITALYKENTEAVNANTEAVNANNKSVELSASRYGPLLGAMSSLHKEMMRNLQIGKDWIASLLTGKENTDKVTISTDKLASVASLALSPVLGVSEAVKDFGQGSLIGTRSADELTRSLTKLQTVAQKFGGRKAGELVSYFLPFTQQIASVKRLETELVGLRARHGGGGAYGVEGAFGKTEGRTDFIENLDAQMTSLNKTVSGLAIATGLSNEETGKYVKQLMQVPRLYDQMIKFSDETTGSVSALEAAIRVSRGTTGELGDAITAINYQFKSFGEVTDTAYEMLAKTHSVSMKLGQSFKDIETPIMNVAKQFRVFGDNTESSIKLVANLSRALMETGLGIEPTTKIIEGITGSIAKMDIAQKAFLSGQTGGATGLRGAFEIDMLLRQGQEGVASVYEKMEEALRKQFGGQIVTVEEAAQSDVAASQMTKQLAFVMEGPFGQLVQNQGQAYHLFEAFAKGTTPTAEVASDAMGQAMEADKAIQTRQANSIDLMANLLKEANMQRSVRLAMDFRREFGSDSVRTQEFLRNYAFSAREQTKRGIDVEYKNPGEEFLGGLKEAMSALGSVGKIVASSVRDKIALREATTEQAEQERTATLGPVAITSAPAVKTGVVEPAVPGTTATRTTAAEAATNVPLIRLEPSEIVVTVRTPDGSEISRQNISAAINAGLTPATKD